MIQQDSYNTNTYYWAVRDGSPGFLVFTLSPNEWTHLALTRDGETRVNTIYINGVYYASITGTGDILYDGTERLSFGRHPIYGRCWNGIIDEVKVYNRALSAAEVAAISHSGRAGQCFNAAAPSGITNNNAIDLDLYAKTGVSITWMDPSSWGDDRISGRCYAVLRNGIPIIENLPYGTTNYTDTTGATNVVYNYSVRFTNGNGLSATTAGTSAADIVDTTPPDTSGWNSLVVVKNGTVVDLSWEHIGLPDTIGYNVYRDTVPDSPWDEDQKVNSSLVTGTSYPGVEVNGDIFFFFGVRSLIFNLRYINQIALSKDRLGGSFANPNFWICKTWHLKRGLYVIIENRLFALNDKRKQITF